MLLKLNLVLLISPLYNGVPSLQPTLVPATSSYCSSLVRWSFLTLPNQPFSNPQPCCSFIHYVYHLLQKFSITQIRPRINTKALLGSFHLAAEYFSSLHENTVCVSTCNLYMNYLGRLWSATATFCRIHQTWNSLFMPVSIMRQQIHLARSRTGCLPRNSDCMGSQPVHENCTNRHLLSCGKYPHHIPFIPAVAPRQPLLALHGV